MTSPALLLPVPKEFLPTNEILKAMLSPGVSDLIFSPGREPRVAKHDTLVIPEVVNGGRFQSGLKEKIANFFNKKLSAADTKRIANDLLGSNQKAQNLLRKRGACDFSYSLPEESRFRVNIFTQLGSYAIVMRVIPYEIPPFEKLNLPPLLLERLLDTNNGLVLVTGLTGSGKSTTLASVIDQINEKHSYHVITIEDPVEYLHRHKNCIIHQREVNSDTPSFGHALRAALRQSPKVIFLGEMRDRETTDVALEAAGTGHLVFSTLHTIDASKTVERIIGSFPASEQHVARIRLASAFRWIVSQRLIPKKDGSGLIPMLEILRATERTRDYVVKGEEGDKNKTLLEAMRADPDSLCFNDHLAYLVDRNLISAEAARAYATDQSSMQLKLSGVNGVSTESVSNFLKEWL